MSLLVLWLSMLAIGDGPPPRPEVLVERPLAARKVDRREARRVLSSGAVAYLLPEARGGAVEIEVLFRAGAYLDPPGKEGLAEIAGACMRTGGTATRPPAQIEAELARLGAALRIEIGETTGRARLTAPPDAAGTAFAIAVDCLRSPGFDAGAVARARTHVLRRLAARNDRLSEIEERLWARLVRGEHFSTRLPSPASLDAITADDLASIPRQLVFPRNLIVSVSGPFDEAAASQWLEEALAGWPNVDAPIPAPPEAGAPSEPGVYLADAGRPLPSARVRVGFAGVRRDHPDLPVLMALMECIGSTLLPSRAERALRLERDLSWEPASRVDDGDLLRGSLAVSAPCFARDARETAAALLAEIRRLGEEPLPLETLAALRQTLVARESIVAADASSLGRRFAQDEIARADPEECARFADRWTKLTAEECIRVARSLLDPAKAIVLVVGSGDALGAEDPAWGSLGAVRRVAP